MTEIERGLAALREPFPPESVGKMPKPYKNDSPKGKSKRPSLSEDDTNPKTRLRGAPLIDRLMHRTAQLSNGCWQWMGAKNSKGYGNIRVSSYGPAYSAHRVSFEYFNGQIPVGLEIDHICMNRACVNPTHLRVATRLENVRHGRTNQNDGKTHCQHGHAFDAANTHRTKDGKRSCRACGRRKMAELRARRAAV